MFQQLFETRCSSRLLCGNLLSWVRVFSIEAVALIVRKL